MVRHCRPSDSAHLPNADGTPQAPGTELETAGAPQPQNSVVWHHLGVTARGRTFVSVSLKGCSWIQTRTCFKRHIIVLILTGFSDELSFPGSVGVCAPIFTFKTFGIQHLCCVGLCHGGLQNVLPA